MEKGTHFGLKNLKLHKTIYDDSLRNREFKKIKYVLFISKQKPNIAFSGVIYPDYDFLGRQLQNLADHNSELELITYCSAPMDYGWGFLFAWHELSSSVCVEYMRSLATAIYKKGNITDFLFRIVMNCENHAISPQWWESISAENKNKIIDSFSKAMDIFSEIKNDYLMKGLEGISDWKFDLVKSNNEIIK